MASEVVYSTDEDDGKPGGFVSFVSWPRLAGMIEGEARSIRSRDVGKIIRIERRSDGGIYTYWSKP